MTPQRPIHRLFEETARILRGRAFLAAILPLVLFLSGCAIHPTGELYQSTLLSYWPLNSAMRTDCPPVTFVNPHCYGYHETQWRIWDCESYDGEFWPTEVQLHGKGEEMASPQKLPHPSEEDDVPSASDRKIPAPVIDGSIPPQNEGQP